MSTTRFLTLLRSFADVLLRLFCGVLRKTLPVMVVCRQCHDSTMASNWWPQFIRWLARPCMDVLTGHLGPGSLCLLSRSIRPSPFSLVCFVFYLCTVFPSSCYASCNYALPSDLSVLTLTAATMPSTYGFFVFSFSVCIRLALNGGLLCHRLIVKCSQSESWSLMQPQEHPKWKACDFLHSLTVHVPESRITSKCNLRQKYWSIKRKLAYNSFVGFHMVLMRTCMESV